MTKTKNINVPAEIIGDFADKLAEHSITNEIQGTTDEGEIIVQVTYDKDDRMGVFELVELVEDYSGEEEEN